MITTAQARQMSDAELKRFVKSGDRQERRRANRELRRRGHEAGKIVGHFSRPKFGRTTVDPFERCEDDIEAIEELHAMLVAKGATLDKESESGSRYYTLADGRQVRLSDHRPNGATANWIANREVINLDAQDFGGSINTITAL